MPICSTLFCYNVNETPLELNSCLRQLAYGKMGFIIVTELIELLTEDLLSMKGSFQR